MGAPTGNENACRGGFSFMTRYAFPRNSRKIRVYVEYWSATDGIKKLTTTERGKALHGAMNRAGLRDVKQMTTEQRGEALVRAAVNAGYLDNTYLPTK